ncbi:C-type lectin-related protein 2 [Plakobranchus ocellatus]|uniref:C-type lectin-related protein 2 n=1 Tax=Plakobranchus ocellatus TaxID=259542 RepID=A0AAV3ZEY3_9GAST|nr:C-type lectin-related protein 2 [Plakobranchus ocellatus]
MLGPSLGTISMKNNSRIIGPSLGTISMKNDSRMLRPSLETISMKNDSRMLGPSLGTISMKNNSRMLGPSLGTMSMKNDSRMLGPSLETVSIKNDSRMLGSSLEILSMKNDSRMLGPSLETVLKNDVFRSEMFGPGLETVSKNDGIFNSTMFFRVCKKEKRHHFIAMDDIHTDHINRHKHDTAKRLLLYVFLLQAPDLNVTSPGVPRENIYQLSFSCTDKCLGATRSSYFKTSEDADCARAERATPWESSSELSCVMMCHDRFQEDCRNVVYNHQNLTCTLVSPLPQSAPPSPLDPTLVGSLYTHYDPFLSCYTTEGFELHTLCGVSACLSSPGPEIHYNDAKAECAKKNAIIFEPRTFEHYALLEKISPNLTWVGMIRKNDTFVWESGETVGSDLNKIIWATGQPSNYQDRQDCVAYHAVDGRMHGLYDRNCGKNVSFICEQKLQLV